MVKKQSKGHKVNIRKERSPSGEGFEVIDLKDAGARELTFNLQQVGPGNF